MGTIAVDGNFAHAGHPRICVLGERGKKDGSAGVKGSGCDRKGALGVEGM